MLPSGFCDFLVGINDEYEDEYVSCKRDSNGIVTVIGKPFKFPFIFGEKEEKREKENEITS